MTFASTWVALCAEPDAIKEASVSPDERFVIERVVVWADAEQGQATEDSPFFRIVERESKRIVTRLPEKGQAVGSDDAKFLWAPDSNRFAWNYRGRGREEMTELFQYDAAAKGGGGFKRLDPPAQKLASSLIAPEHTRQIKALKLPAKSQLRDIWDSSQVTAWPDEATAELRVHSIRHVQNTTAKEVPVLDALFQVTIRFDPKGKWKVIKTEKLASDAEAQVPDGE